MTTAAATHAVQLFGPPTFRSGAETIVFLPDKRHQLLAYLAYRGTWVSRESLAELFWTGSSDTVRGNLRRLLGRVQKLPWLTGLEVERSRVRWNVSTDVAVFNEALLEEGGDRATMLYQGPLLYELEGYDDSDFVTWLEVERALLTARWREDLLQRAAAARNGGRTKRQLDLLGSLLRQEPFDEEALQFYLVNATDAGQARQALELFEVFEKRLQRELGITPSSKTLQLVREARKRLDRAIDVMPMLVPTDAGSPVAPARTLVTRTLPKPVTSFVGRDLELADITHLLLHASCSVLTVLGPGGVGKTRLALQAATELEPHFAGGAYFVSLAPLAHPEAILPQIAKTLGVTAPPGGELLEAVTGYLIGNASLIVLDNFEHVMGGSMIVSDLVSACSSLRVIVTSRERLLLDEEHLFHLSGLPLPTIASSSEDARAFDSTRLFIERAKRVSILLDLGDDEVAAIAKICTLVEGSPLGIELAATWMRALPAAEIAHEIGASLDFLASASRNTVDRHRSLRATFDYSWQLLSDAEKNLLAKLSVFRGGFTREAATYVAEANLALLSALIDKSLLRFIANRYGFHPLIWQFAREKRQAADGSEELNERHAAFFAQLVEATKVPGGEQVQALKRLDLEYPNVLQTLTWCAVNAAQDSGLRLAGGLEVFWSSRGRFDEGYDWLQKLLAREPGGQDSTLYSSSRRSALNAAGTLANKRADYEAARVHFSELAEAAHEAGDTACEINALNGLGMTAQAVRDYDQARQHYEQALDLLERLQLLPALSVTLKNLGNVAMEQHDFPKAKRLYEMSLAYSQQSGHQINLAIVKVNLGLAHYRLGDLAVATDQLLDALEFARALPYLPATVSSLGFLGVVHIDTRAFAEAGGYLGAALSLCWEYSDKPGLAFTLENLASWQAAQLRLTEAALLWGAADALRQSLRFPLEPSWQGRYRKFVGAAEERSDVVAFRGAWQRGQIRPLVEMVSWAQALAKNGRDVA